MNELVKTDDVTNEMLDGLDDTARAAIVKSQMAMFEYAIATYHRMARLTRALGRLEDDLLTDDQLDLLAKVDKFELWKEINKHLGQSFLMLRDFNKMVLEFTTLKKILKQLEDNAAITSALEIKGSRTGEVNDKAVAQALSMVKEHLHPEDNGRDTTSE